LGSPVDRNVFIDTSIFIANNYAYNNPTFKALVEYVLQDRVHVVLSSVTVEEVKSHIEKDSEKAVTGIKKARSEARILRNLSDHPIAQLFIDLDSKRLQQMLTQQFDNFLSAARVTIVPISEADVEKVFEIYFKREAPFGEGKKKSEFPDAFVLSALNEWCESEGEKAYVVSSDPDMKEAVVSSPCLIHLHTLEEFIARITLYYEELAPLALRLIEENKSVIKDAVSDQFSCLSFWIEDQDGYVDEIRVDEIEDGEFYLFSVVPGEDGESAEAHFELTTGVKFLADVTYDNLDTAAYDSEDKVLIPWEKISKTVEQSEIVIVDIKCLFSVKEPYDFQVDDVTIRHSKDIGISVYQDDGWPYK
jgi:hypothetical protein